MFVSEIVVKGIFFSKLIFVESLVKIVLIFEKSFLFSCEVVKKDVFLSSVVVIKDLIGKLIKEDCKF